MERLPDAAAMVFHHITGIKPAGQNLLVIKTEEGAASVVAGAIDQMNPDGIVGTVAGDDTIILATRNRTAQNKLQIRLERINH